MNDPQSKLDLYVTPREAWDAMYDDCLKARNTIDFEQYILKDDEAGLRFLDLFRDKAQKGVQIRLILDRIGSRTLYSSEIVKTILEAGGYVHFYNKLNILNLFLPHTWFPRNHSKLMLVDGNTAYVGSVCISKEMADWRDLHARIEGPVTKDIQIYFNHAWDKRFRHWRKQHTKKMRANLQAHHELTFVAAQSRFRTNALYKELLRQIRQAKECVYLVTPYFLPPFLLRHALFHAAARGVEIKIMMSAESDVPVADYVSQSYFHKFNRLGLKILLYKPTVVHAKYAVIDNKWATLGSTNMDYLSLHRNREANIIVRDTNVIEKLRLRFQEDEKDCFLADQDYCDNRSIYSRMAGILARPLKRFL